MTYMEFEGRVLLSGVRNAAESTLSESDQDLLVKVLSDNMEGLYNSLKEGVVMVG